MSGQPINPWHHFVAKAAWNGCRRAGQGARSGASGAVGARPDPRVDHRRHRLPKKGRHSVGVARQYCGQIGKQDNGQVAVSLTLATDHTSLPVAFRLCLPKTWVGDAERRARTSVPDGVCFQIKPAIALDQIHTAMMADLPPESGPDGRGLRQRHRPARRRDSAGTDLRRQGPILADCLGSGGCLACRRWTGAPLSVLTRRMVASILREKLKLLKHTEMPLFRNIIWRLKYYCLSCYGIDRKSHAAGQYGPVISEKGNE